MRCSAWLVRNIIGFESCVFLLGLLYLDLCLNTFLFFFRIVLALLINMIMVSSPLEKVIQTTSCMAHANQKLKFLRIKENLYTIMIQII